MTKENFKKYDLNAAVKKIQAVYRGFAIRRLIGFSFAKFSNVCDEVEAQINSSITTKYSYANGVDYINFKELSHLYQLPLFFVPSFDTPEAIYNNNHFLTEELRKEEKWLEQAIYDRIRFLQRK